MNSVKRRIETVSYGLFISIGWTSVLVPTLILSVEEFYHQSDAALGLFYAATSLTGAVGSFVCGLATERWGRRLVTPTVGLLLGLGLIGQAMAPSWELFFLMAVIANLGAGALDGDINGLFLDLHAAGQTGGALNMLHLFFSAGAVGGAFMIGQLAHWDTPWQAIIGTSGLAVVLLAVLAAALPLPSGKRSAPTPDTEKTTPISTKERSLAPFACLAVAICLYVAAELGVTSWIVKYVAQTDPTLAAGALAIFWGGITLGRLISSRTADRFHATMFTIVCFVASTITLIGAILTSNALLALFLYALTGVFYGPIFPMIMVIGGTFYPHRLAVLSGSLSAAATVGAVVYPGVMGLISVQQGIQFGMLGAALLGLPAALALLVAMAFVKTRSKSPSPRSA